MLGIPTNVRSLADGASPGGTLPAGAHELTNGYGHLGYGGPCPPPGAPHVYVLTVLAERDNPANYADLHRDAVVQSSFTVTYLR